MEPVPSAGARSDRAGLVSCVAILALTLAQLAVLTLVPDLPQAQGKAFGARLAAYPVLMLALPVMWWLAARRGGPPPSPLPWTAFALVMAPFLVDVTGNTLDLYDRVVWWDDANHFANWFLLCAGIGLLLRRASLTPPWALGVVVVGAGALLAILWELAEWYAFIRHGTELATAYQDTLGDEALGTAGGAAAALLVARTGRSRPAERRPRCWWPGRAGAGRRRGEPPTLRRSAAAEPRPATRRSRRPAIR